MDPIGALGTIIAILQLSGKITTLCLDYKARVKDAPADITRLLTEVRSLRGILERLVDLANTSAAMVSLPSLQDADTRDGVLATCLADLTQLTTILEKGLSNTANWRALLWPLRQRDVTKAVEQITQAKTTLHLALAADTGANVLEILTKTRDMALATNIALLEEDGKTQQVLDWLPSADCFSKHERALESRVAGTGSWLLRTKEYCQWREQQCASLWLYGIPGCGKTVLCSTVIEDIQSHCSDNPREILLYFHFDGISHENASVETVVGTFIKQAIYRMGGVPSRLQTLYSNSKYSDDTSAYAGKPRVSLRRDLEKELHEILSDFTRAYIVVDALDECKNDHLDQVMSLLKRMMSWQASAPQVFIASRHRAQIHDGLKDLNPLTVATEESLVQEDIGSFIRSVLETDSRLRKWPSSFRVEVEERLIRQSGGMFQWAECQLATLATCRNPAAAKKTLTSRPKSLDELYGDILQSIPEADFDMARRSLVWLSFSHRPLRLAELAEALAIGQSDDDTVLYDPDLKPWDIYEALDVCAGLVTISSRSGGEEVTITETTSVKLTHYSVKEFLISETIRDGPLARYALENNLAHQYLVESCLAYIVHAGAIEGDIELPLLDYAARYWMLHVGKFSEDRDDVASRPLPWAAMQQMFLSTTAFSKWTATYNFERPWLRAGQRAGDRRTDRNVGESPTALYCASYLGLQPVCESLVSSGVDVNARCGLLGSALHAAAYRGHLSIVQVLARAGADVNMSHISFIGTPIVGAAMEGHEDIVRFLLDAGAHPQTESARFFERRDDALCAAATKGHLAICKVLIDHGARDYRVMKGEPFSSLDAAVRGRHFHVAREIISRARDADEDTPMRGIAFDHASSLYAAQAAAYRNGDAMALRELISLGTTDRAALKFATFLGDEVQVREVLSRTDQVHQGYRWKDDPLALAVDCGNFAIAEILVAKGTCPKSSFCRAAETGNIEAMDFLTNVCGDRIDDDVWISALVDACGTEGNIKVVRLLTSKISNFEKAAAGSMMRAARKGVMDVFEELLSQGAKIPTEGEDADCLVAAAVEGGSIPLVKLLFDNGLHPNINIDLCSRCHTQHDVLLAAAALPSLDMAMALLDAGLDVNHARLPQHRYGREDVVSSPLAEVIQRDNGSLALELLRRGANPDGGEVVAGKDCHSPLVAAIRKDLDHVVAALLEHGASPNRPGLAWIGSETTFPIILAAENGRLSITRRLISHGADVNAARDGGYTALQTAASHGWADVVRALLYDYKADVSLGLENGSLASHSAAARGHAPCLELLLDYGLDMDAVNRDGRTPLHFAAESSNWPCVRLLLDRGARTDLRADESSLTALDMLHLAREGKRRYNLGDGGDDISEEELEALLSRMESF